MSEPKTDITAVSSLFATRKLNTQGIQAVGVVRLGFDILLSLLEQKACPSREFSIAKTKLEEACMYTVKAITLERSYQEIS